LHRLVGKRWSSDASVRVSPSSFDETPPEKSSPC
jgi:hypothetical protein